MLVNYQSFYTSYPSDYHTYKVCTLTSILKNIDQFNDAFLNKSLTDINNSDYKRFLKSELRITVFHAIETLFELIFALDGTSNGLKDKVLFESISSSNFSINYKRIQNIANDEDIQFLDVEVEYYGLKAPFWKYIFYFGINPPEEAKDRIDNLNKSEKAIKIFLKEIARIFSNREEYNAYKHGNRILNSFTDFQIKAGENTLNFDLTDSMSYFFNRKENKTVTNSFVSTKIFNTEKDIHIALLCSQLINNIIILRKQSLVSGSKNDNDEFYYFREEGMLKVISLINKADSPGLDSFEIKFPRF